MITTQLTLRLTPQEIYRLDNFLFADPQLQGAVEEFCQLTRPAFLYLSGASGSGKTHLCLAIAEFFQKNQQSMAYLNLQELKNTVAPESLHSLLQADVVCFDDLEAIAGDTDWEEALFHCFNELRINQQKVLLATQNTPVNLTIRLADLRSRLATALVYSLPLMQDELKQQALVIQAQSRGLILPEEVAQYLLRHYGRDMPSLMSVLKILDKASLEAQRRLTIPFVREVMQHG